MRKIGLCLLASLVAGVALPSIALAGPKVLICAADSTTYATSVKNSLTALAVFDAVDVVDCQTTTPTLTTLKTYNAILTWDNYSFLDRTALGNNLADYVDQGGGVVQMMYEMYTGWELLGRWSTGGYSCLLPATPYIAGTVSLKSTGPNDPTSPLVQGITSLTTTTNRGSGVVNTAKGAVSVWDWSDGKTAICKLTGAGGPSVALNFYYGSGSGLTGDAVAVIKNALLFAGGGAGPFVPNPTKLTFPDTGTGATAAGTTVVFTNTSMMTATATSFTISGANASDFNITSAPSPPISVASMGTFPITVNFVPTAMGARSATLKVGVMGQTTTNDLILNGNGIGPKVVITPNPLKLGTSGVGVPVTKDITVSNQGGNVKINTATITLGGAEFSLVSGVGYPINLSSGAQFNQAIQFNPTMTGLRNGELTLTTDDPSNPTIKIPLQGTSGPPMIQLDAGSIAFAATNVGATSAASLVTITNSGFSDLDVTAIALGGTNAGDFTLDKMAFPTKLSPGASGKFSVRFVPTLAGSRSGTVTVSSNDPSAATKAISLFGTATQAAVSVGPSALSFGTIKVNVPSTAQSVTVSNTGSGTLSVMAYSFSGSGASSYSLSGTMAPVAVPGGGSTSIGVICTPKSVGAVDATFTILTDVGTRTVGCTCTGSAPKISVAPSTFDFGPVQVQTMSMAKDIVISNTGNSDLKVTSIALTGTNAGEFTLTGATTPKTLTPGSTLAFTAVFNPNATGAKVADILLVSDDPTAPMTTVKLTGSGVMLGLTAMPMTVDWGMVQLGASADKSVTLTNTGSGTVTITNIAIGGVGAGRFRTSQAVPFDITVGKTAMVTMTYAPVTAGVDQATMTLTAMSLGATPVSLKGTGISPIVSVTPMTLDFGPLTVGRTSAPKTVTLKNGGTLPVTISSVLSSSDSFIVDDAMLMKTLPAGATTTFTVTFSPMGPGALKADMGLTLNGVYFGKVTASGSGIAAAMGGCAVSGPRTPPMPWQLSLLLLGGLLLGRRRSRR